MLRFDLGLASAMWASYLEDSAVKFVKFLFDFLELSPVENIPI